MKNVDLICDLQFGSTGKGLIAGYLAQYHYQPDCVVTAWSANAGHTYIDKHGLKYTHSMLANGVVSPNLKYVLIGPGSLINIDKLMQECVDCKAYLARVIIIIHQNAAVIEKRHIDEENKTMVGIGSTRKGCGAALTEKIQRQVGGRITAGNHQDRIYDMARIRGLNMLVADNQAYNAALDNSHKILVEGAQGYSLGINSGFYPYVTSRECTPAQIMSDCGVPLDRLNKVIGCMRTFPIRVANRYDEAGKQIGYSGPHYPDQNETSFEEIGVEPELTTVTQLPRRVFTFSQIQMEEAYRMCCPDEIFVNFMNYLPEECMPGFIDRLQPLVGDSVAYTGHGPTANDVFEFTGSNL